MRCNLLKRVQSTYRPTTTTADDPTPPHPSRAIPTTGPGCKVPRRVVDWRRARFKRPTPCSDHQKVRKQHYKSRRRLTLFEGLHHVKTPTLVPSIVQRRKTSSCDPSQLLQDPIGLVRRVYEARRGRETRERLGGTATIGRR